MSRYDKALKKLAGQISRTIKNDTTYRNIPFGNSQLDIHSDGKTVLLAAKVLSPGKKSFKVREFQMPVSKLQKFLVGDEMRTASFDNSNITLYFNEEKVMKQISIGIAQLVYDGKKNETWIFPFYNRVIAFKKSYSTRRLDGGVASMEISSNNLLPPILFPVSGVILSRENFPVSGFILSRENKILHSHFVDISAEFKIYRTLTRDSFTLPSADHYYNISESSMHLEAV